MPEEPREPGDDRDGGPPRVTCGDSAAARSDVVLDLLDELHAARYAPAGWARFVARSWRLARQTARAHPQLTRSWRHVATGLTLTELVALAAESFIGGNEGHRAARRAAPGAALCLAYTLTDAYVHLGMNHEAREAPLHDTVGIPTVLTLGRSAMAGWLFGHLMGRAYVNDSVLRAALVATGMMDIADGALARALCRPTRLGAYLDSEADVAVALALTLSLLARRALPAWLVAGMLTRWLAPFAYALLVYLGGGRRVRIGSTLTGKVAGVAQTATLGVALLPEYVRRRRPGAQHMLHVATLTLLIAAPLVQLKKTRSGVGHSRAWRRS